MKSFKKLLALVLAGMTAVNMSAAALAESEAADDGLGDYLNEILPQSLSDENVDIFDEICRYAHETIPYCLPVHALYGTYNVSEPIQIHNWDGGADTEKYLVIVSENNVMVGSLTVEYVDSRIISAFRSESIPEINAALASGAEIQLGYSNDCFLVYSGNTLSVVENPYFVDETFVDELTVDPARSEIIQTAEAAAAVQARVQTWQASTVKNVGNRVHPENDELVSQLGEDSTKEYHLCWAACVASMAMQNRPGTLFSTTDVYYLCKDMNYSDKPSETYPHGDSKWIKFALKYIASITPKKTAALSSDQVIANLQQNKPMYVSLRGTNSKGETIRHGMVLFHYTKVNDTSGQYTFMDPSPVDSDGGRVTAVIDQAVMTDGSGLSVTSRTGAAYVSWTASYYKS